MTTLSSADIDWLAALLMDAGVAEIMPRFRNLGDGDVQQKTSAADLVTEADVNAERMITGACWSGFRTHSSSARKPWLMIRNCSTAGAEPTSWPS